MWLQGLLLQVQSRQWQASNCVLLMHACFCNKDCI